MANKQYTEDEPENPWGDLRQHWEESAKKERPDRMKNAHRVMVEIARLTNEMRTDGWKEVSYCPKDGSMFWAWDPLCSLPYKCSYRGVWPDGKWDAYCDGDIWPSRPVLFKPIDAASGRNDD